MKSLPALLLIFALVGCSKKTPAHPDVGLSISSNGGSGSCSFYRYIDGNIKPASEARKYTYTEGSHKVELQWEVTFGDVADHYVFDLIVDGVQSRKELFFEGFPITLVEEPFQVILLKHQ